MSSHDAILSPPSEAVAVGNPADAAVDGGADGAVSERKCYFQVGPLSFSVRCDRFTIHCRSLFGTSHSATTERCNALWTVSVGGNVANGVGNGEVGLPPKKKGIYYADQGDVGVFFGAVINAIEEQLPLWTELFPGPDDPQYVEKLERAALSATQGAFGDQGMSQSLIRKIDQDLLSPSQLHITILSALLLSLTSSLLEKAEVSDHDLALSWRAPSSGFESALFDLLCSSLGVLIGGFVSEQWDDLSIVKNEIVEKLVHQRQKKEDEKDVIVGCSFYTVALNEDLHELEQSARFGLQYTPLLKIKLNDNTVLGAKILQKLEEICREITPSFFKWSIDANAAWNTRVAHEYLDVLKPYRDHIYMVEQPFPANINDADFDAAERAGWADLKNAFADQGMLIYADESMHNSKDVEKLKDLSHGVNVKLEKTGGIREALKAVETAKSNGLAVWIGTMLGSCLNSSSASHLLCSNETRLGDMDGDLLTTRESQRFQGGFTWGTLEDGFYGTVRFARSATGNATLAL